MNIAKQAYECGAVKILQSNMGADQSRKETAVKQAVSKIVDAYASAQDAAERVVWGITTTTPKRITSSLIRKQRNCV